MWFLEYLAVNANQYVILVSLTQQLQGEAVNVYADPWTNEINLTEMWDYFKFTLFVDLSTSWAQSLFRKREKAKI